jgi:single-strand DNA-binding protein
MNNISLIGRLTRDPDIRKIGENRNVCTFTLAVDDTYSRSDRTDFIRVSVFGSQGDTCKRYLRKGLLAGVSGRIRTDQYTDSEGVIRYPVEVTADKVQFLQWPERTAESAEDAADAPAAADETAEAARDEAAEAAAEEDPGTIAA